ncbi:response regulator [candidate division KSB1 bacterium]|nr:response regulator [candidate division KSB1 bacterium]
MNEKTILIIDDNKDIVENTRIVLETHGYKVYDAPNGEIGLKKVKELKPDLVILDVMMNDLTEGFDVARTLRAKTPPPEYIFAQKIPIIMMTSIHDKFDFHFNKDVGTEWLPVDIFLEKPVKPDILVQKIKECLSFMKPQ